MKAFYAALYLILLSSALTAQEAIDRDMQWTTLATSCSQVTPEQQVFKVTEVKPEIYSMSKASFEKEVRQMFHELLDGSRPSGTVKVQLWYAPESPMCVHAVGVSGLSLAPAVQQKIVERFTDMAAFYPGRQRGSEVVCQGTVILDLQEGSVHAMRIVNLTFTE